MCDVNTKNKINLTKSQIKSNFKYKQNENQTKINPKSSKFVATPKFLERFFSQLQQRL